MSLLIYTLRNVAGAIVTPPLVFLLISLMIVLYLKNKKVVSMQKMILGGSVNSLVELTLSQLVLGIIGGCIGSLILTSLGVVFSDNSGISYLFMISILLAFIKPRLICFSYSGAILGFVSIIIKLLNIAVPQSSQILNLDIDILYLILLVGVFHIVEGVLVMIDGDRGAVPVFTNRNGKILGGYALRRYWVLPIAIMIAVNIDRSTSSYTTELIQNPNWWPLIESPSALALLASSVVSIFPFYTILGYSSVTFTKTKREKAISSGVHILIYGLILIAASQITRIGIVGEMLVLAFMPIAHEFMLKHQVRNEERGVPKFVSDSEGLVVLEISTDFKMKEYGIDIESKVLSINDKIINSETEVYTVIKENLYNTIMKIKDSSGVIKDINFRHNKNTRLGILLVPRNVEKEEMVPIEDDSFNSVLSKIKKSDSIEHKKIDIKDNKEDDKENK
ncbi:signal protein PDZ [Clostridium saccharoperbutylacetonicum]